MRDRLDGRRAKGPVWRRVLAGVLAVLAIIAVTHEFAHGIFAAYNKIKIKKTGFGFFPFFLPVFLAAFVELDEKRMAKKSKFSQMAVLSAGTFANVLTSIFFFVVLLIFFSLAFTSSGVIFDSYSYSVVGLAGITSINGISIDNASYEKISDLMDDKGFSKIESEGANYFVDTKILELQKPSEEGIILYDDAPAINSGLLPKEESIAEVNGVEINTFEDLREELSKYSPGEEIIIGMHDGEKINDKKVVRSEEHTSELQSH